MVDVKTGYYLLGTSAILMGFEVVIPDEVPCLGGLLGLTAIGLLIAGVIIIFRQRKQMNEKMQFGAKVSLVGLICMGILFVILLVMVFAMVLAIMDVALDVQTDEEIPAGKMLDIMYNWVMAIAIVGFLDVIVTIATFAGPNIFSDKMLSKVLVIVCSFSLLILSVAGIIVAQQTLDNMREKYKDDVLDDETIAEMQGELDTGWVLLLNVLRFLVYCGLGAACIFTGYTGEFKVLEPPQPQYGYGRYPPQYGAGPSVPRGYPPPRQWGSHDYERRNATMPRQEWQRRYPPR
jgi:hypothetical protein